MQLPAGVDLFEALVRVETRLWNVLDHGLAEQGRVALPTLFALRVLERAPGPRRVQDLSEELGITVGAASRLADRLERDGLARRSPHPHDRRSSVLTLTGAGTAAHDHGVAALDDLLAHMLSGLDGVQVATLALGELLHRLDSTTKDVTP